MEQKELKTKKMVFLIRPSIAEATVKIAYMKHDSFNNLINTLLEEFVKENAELIDQYDKIFGDEKQ